MKNIFVGNLDFGNLVIGGSAGCVKLMREPVSLEEMRATLDQHGRNGRLTTGDAASQSYAQHWHIRIIERLKAGTSKSRLALMQYIHVVCAHLRLDRKSV